MNMLFLRSYSINKCRHILKQYYTLFKKKGEKLSHSQRDEFEKILKSLDRAILNKDKIRANEEIKKLEKFDAKKLKKTPFEFAIELIITLIVSLFVAIIVRQIWFELYEIPTGSMRPTFMEKDRLTVSKTTFGLNIPLITRHLYFDPKLVQRTSIVIFSGDHIPLEDNMSNYFWVFPAYKRYIKRLIGKPLDSIYFYGGKLYGVDEDGKAIPELITSPWMKELEHIPFIQFEGELTNPNPNELIFSHMHTPVGQIKITHFGNLKAEVFDGKNWVKEKPTSKPHNQIQMFSDIFGIGNFALARLLTKEQLKQIGEFNKTPIDEGLLYLELIHHPSLSYPEPLFYQTTIGIIPMLNPYKSIIPLNQNHLDLIMKNLYTSRFVVENGKAKLYDATNSPFTFSSPKFPDIPDGTYEFYHGKLTKILWGGIPSLAAQENPLYSKDPKNVQRLFNLGIQMHEFFDPNPENPDQFPNRYAYFRNGDLYLMGAPILMKNDKNLISFLNEEREKEKKGTENKPYIPFIDKGPPLNEDGSYNVEFIRNFGVTVPDGHYLVLGDNHARSADSRIFGFVPEANLEGAPSLIIWPPYSRLGPPAQKPYPFMNLPRAIIWTLAIVIFLILFIRYRTNLKKSIFRR